MARNIQQTFASVPKGDKLLLALMDFRVVQMSRRAFDLAGVEIEESAEPGQNPNATLVSNGFPADDLSLNADLIDKVAGEVRQLDSVLRRVDRNITAAAKRAVKQMGYAPLRLNSRRAQRIFSLR